MKLQELILIEWLIFLFQNKYRSEKKSNIDSSHEFFSFEKFSASFWKILRWQLQYPLFNVEHVYQSNQSLIFVLKNWKTDWYPCIKGTTKLIFRRNVKRMIIIFIEHPFPNISTLSWNRWNYSLPTSVGETRQSNWLKII